MPLGVLAVLVECSSGMSGMSHSKTNSFVARSCLLFDEQFLSRCKETHEKYTRLKKYQYYSGGGFLFVPKP